MWRDKLHYAGIKNQTSTPSLIRDCLYDCWLLLSNTYFLPPGGSVCQGESDACPELLEKTIRKIDHNVCYNVQPSDILNAYTCTITREKQGKHTRTYRGCISSAVRPKAYTADWGKLKAESSCENIKVHKSRCIKVHQCNLHTDTCTHPTQRTEGHYWPVFKTPQ